MQFFGTSILKGANKILLENKKLEKLNNPKITYGFAKHDDCIDFLNELNILDREEFIEESKNKKISTLHNLILKYLERIEMDENWFLVLKNGIDNFVNRNEETEDFQEHKSKRIFQIINEHVLYDIDSNVESRKCLSEIKNLHETADFQQSKRNLEVGDRGEENTLRYEEEKSEVEYARIVSLYSNNKGYDVESRNKDGLEKKIEVKASDMEFNKAEAKISWGQWIKAKKMNSREDCQYEFHFWHLKEESLAILTRADILKKIPQIEIDMDSKSHWEKFNLSFADFEDKFFKPFDS